MADPIAWPFAWGGEYAEQLEWLTDVLAAPTGGTQHRRLRESPRTTLSFATLLEGDTRRRVESLLRGNQSAAWDVPVQVDGCRLTADAAAAATTLSLDPGIARITAGSRVMLVDGDHAAWEVREVSAVGASSLTLASGLDAAWPTGSLVVPVRAGRLVSAPSIDRFTSDATGLVALAFRLDDSLDSAAGFSGDTYRSYPVFEFQPVWTGDPIWQPEQSLGSVDYGVATPLVVDLAGVPLGRTAMQYVAATAAEVAEFRSALFALAGRWSPAWVPTWTADVRVAAATPAAGAYLDVTGPQLADQTLYDNRRDLRIALVDGTVLYRRIVSVTDMGSGIERLALDAAITDGLQIDDVAMVSFLVLSVQEADTNVLRYFQPDVMDCELTWRELDHEL